MSTELEEIRRLSASLLTARLALKKIAGCPNPNSVEDCHDQMSDAAKDALADTEHRPSGSLDEQLCVTCGDEFPCPGLIAERDA